MGNQKLRWTVEEEDALRAGVEKHGAGKWKNILVDTEFAHRLSNRSNVDLKDKWRNMGTAYGQGTGANAVVPKGKPTVTNAPILKTENSPSVDVSKDNVIGRNPQSPKNVENAVNYQAMILEALSSLKDPNGSDFRAIMGFVEKKYDSRPSLRSSLISKLRRLVSQGTLEKVRKRYKIKDAALGTETPMPKQRDVRSRPLQESISTTSAETLEEAAKTAAKIIAEAENKSFLAAEAVRESERVSQMAEDAHAMFTHLKEVSEQWEDEMIPVLKVPQRTV